MSKALSSGTSRGSRRKFTLEFKREAVQLVTLQGLSLAEAARRLGIHANLLRNWKQSWEQNGPPASVQQPSVLEAENARLRAENERLRMEREILKKATAFFARESR
jgi:transposase